MQGIKNALKGVQYANPALGERLYELCRKATTRHIDRPDEILNQQVVYMINSDMAAYGAARDAVTCLKRRLQMEHPQKQYLSIILTSKVLQECHAAIGMYQGELLQEVAYILRTQHTNSPAAARTRQAAMDALRHFGAGGVDAYRQARQQGGIAPGMPVQQRDPAAVAAERESLLDEITRLVEQAGTSTELLNELILNKSEGPDESAALRKELLSDVRELRALLDGYMSQLAALTGSDAEAAMKKALEAVDQLDAALTLEKDVDAELKELKEKGQLPPAAATLPPPDAAAAGSSSSAAAAAAGSSATAAAAAAANKMESMNLIDLDDEPGPAAASTAAAAAAAADPFGMGPVPRAGPQDPFAPIAAAGPHPPADPFAAAAFPGMPPAAATAPAAFPPAVPAAADPFAALAASGGSAPGPVGVASTGFDEPPAFGAPFPPVPTSTGPPPPAPAAAAVPAAAAAGGSAPAAGSAGGTADPFADAAPAWGGPSSAAPAAATAAGGFDSLAAAAPAAAAAVAPPSSGGMPAPASAAVPASIPPPLQQQLCGSGGGVGPYGMQPAVPSPYGMPAAAAGAAGLGAAGISSSSSSGPYGAPVGMGPYGAAAPAAGVTGGPYSYSGVPTGGMPTGGYGSYSSYGGAYGAPPGPYGMPGQMGMVGQMGPGSAGPGGMGLYPQVPGSTAYGPGSQAGPYPAAALGQQQSMAVLPQQPQSQQQQLPISGIAPVSAPPPSIGYGAAAAPAAPDVVLSPTNPFASSVPATGAAPAAGAAAGSNPFGAPVGGSNVEQEWNAFFSRGQTANP